MKNDHPSVATWAAGLDARLVARLTRALRRPALLVHHPQARRIFGALEWLESRQSLASELLRRRGRKPGFSDGQAPIVLAQPLVRETVGNAVMIAGPSIVRERVVAQPLPAPPGERAVEWVTRVERERVRETQVVVPRKQPMAITTSTTATTVNVINVNAEAPPAMAHLMPAASDEPVSAAPLSAGASAREPAAREAMTARSPSPAVVSARENGGGVANEGRRTVLLPAGGRRSAVPPMLTERVMSARPERPPLELRHANPPLDAAQDPPSQSSSPSLPSSPGAPLSLPDTSSSSPPITPTTRARSTRDPSAELPRVRPRARHEEPPSSRPRVQPRSATVAPPSLVIAPAARAQQPDAVAAAERPPIAPTASSPTTPPPLVHAEREDRAAPVNPAAPTPSPHALALTAGAPPRPAPEPITSTPSPSPSPFSQTPPPAPSIDLDALAEKVQHKLMRLAVQERTRRGIIR